MMKKYLWLAGLIVALGLFGGCRAETVQSERTLKVNDTLYYGTDEVARWETQGVLKDKSILRLSQTLFRLKMVPLILGA
ncbi:hypothetical protein SDC9_77062 [bioreactor metagenome]|uniref:Uncharacterized protein n=1 Tax=bioreactor metagenome TaxID=1076179 RepID=A0A644YPF9_9ZZZZ